tara:strand:+ start:259 stop:441 length:183 start_codon:yes stop_codon:yes gene_type:complete
MTSFKDMIQTVYGAVMSASEQRRLAEMQRIMNLKINSSTGGQMSKKELEKLSKPKSNKNY